MMDHQPKQSWPLPLTRDTNLDFKADAFGVEVRGIEPGDTPRLEVHGEDGDRIDISVREDDHTIKVRAHIDQHFSWRRQGDVRLRLLVPRDVEARLQTDAGSIDVRHLGPCNLEASADAGRLRLEDVHGRLRLNTDAGQITGQQISGQLDVRADAGTVRLGIDGLDPGEHRIRADVGSVNLELAPNLPVRLDLRVSAGSVDSRVRSQPDAPAVLKVSTDVGSVKIRRSDGTDERDEQVEGVRVNVRGFKRGQIPPFPPIPPMPPMPPIPPMPHFRTFFGGDRDEGAVKDGGEWTPRENRQERTTERRPVNPEVERILGMVERGELTATDADVLLRALEHE